MSLYHLLRHWRGGLAVLALILIGMGIAWMGGAWR